MPRRRFPPQPFQIADSNDSTITMFIVAGVALAGVVFLANIYDKNSKKEITSSKRHHAKGVGFSKMNEQFDKLRKKIRKVSPNLDESYYEYSRHNPKRHR